MVTAGRDTAFTTHSAMFLPRFRFAMPRHAYATTYLPPLTSSTGLAWIPDGIDDQLPRSLRGRGRQKPGVILFHITHPAARRAMGDNVAGFGEQQAGDVTDVVAAGEPTVTGMRRAKRLAGHHY